MSYQSDLQALQIVLHATKQGKLQWVEDDDDWYSAPVGDRFINVRFLYYEATNQPGADRHTIQVLMPGMSGKFACGTEGFELLLQILSEAFGWDMGDES